VPQDLHDGARVDIERGKQRSTGAPGVVDLDIADARLLAAEREVAGEVPRLVGSAERGREDQRSVLPGIANGGPASRLALGAELERRDADIGQRQDGLRAWRLGLAVTEFASCSCAEL
jgi:hypothetical protein